MFRFTDCAAARGVCENDHGLGVSEGGRRMAADAAPAARPPRRSVTMARAPGLLRSSTASFTSGKFGGVETRLRKLATPSKKPDLEWMPLTAGQGAKLDSKDYPTWEELRQMDQKRMKVLGYARDMSPLDTIGKIWLLRRTILPRLLRHYLLWVVLVTFGSTAACARLGYGSDAAQTEAVLEGGGNFVAFMVIFYVGYCYQRYEGQFDEVQMIMHHIVNACLEARAAFDDQEETFRLWRYLNLMHASAYCGLTEELTEDNFFLPLCEKHGFLGEKGSEMHERELRSLRKMDLDQDGARVCSMYEVWAFEVIKGEQRRSPATFSPPIHASLVSEVRSVGNHIKKLFACRYQVLPFIYTHLVSAAATLFLMFASFSKGLNFTPDESIGQGLVLPFLAMFLTSLTTFGLLEVGNTILDPFGTDPEDFALLHFVEWTSCASFEAIKIEHVGPRLKDSTPFYTAGEIEAAMKILRSLIRRRRWHKLVGLVGDAAARAAPGGGLGAGQVLRPNRARQRIKRAQTRRLDAAEPSVEHPGRQQLGAMRDREDATAVGNGGALTSSSTGTLSC